ncbi:MAG: hypothetical protein ACXWBM_03885, partial [Chthoniobacterales bacterium]
MKAVNAFSLTSLIFLLQVSLSFGDATDVAARTRAWRAQHEREILSEFVELLTIPNLASDASNIERNAAAISAMC